MTKEEKLAVFKAHLDGKTIEFREKTPNGYGWRPVSMPSWAFHTFDYRVKPEEIPADTPTIDWKASYEALSAGNKKLQSAYDEMKEQRDALITTNNNLRDTTDKLKSANYDLNKAFDKAEKEAVELKDRLNIAFAQRDKAEGETARLRTALNALHDTLHNAILS